MKALTLKGELRKELGTSSMKVLRNKGFIPCVIYGGAENHNFMVQKNDLNQFIYTANAYLVELLLDGKTHHAKIQHLQFHPIKDEVLHVDFQEIKKNKKIKMKIPVNIKGVPKGVLAGGKLFHKEKFLTVSGFPDEILDNIDIDVTEIELGKSIRVEDLKFDKISLVENPKNVIVTVKLSRAALGIEDAAKPATDAAATPDAAATTDAKKAAPADGKKEEKKDDKKDKKEKKDKK